MEGISTNVIREAILADHRAAMAALPQGMSPWRRYRTEERIRRNTLARLRRLTAVEIEAAVNATLRKEEALKRDPAFRRAVRIFDGHSQYGWEKACQHDGRLIRETRAIGWDATRRAILAVRRGE